MTTAPPLAIALIGDWGAGKSSVMLQVQRRIEELADQIAGTIRGCSVFAANVRQVRFNAWDYSDDQAVVRVWWTTCSGALAADPASRARSRGRSGVGQPRTAPRSAED